MKYNSLKYAAPLFFALLCSFVLYFPLSSQVKPDAIWGSNMVIQQNAEITIKGDSDNSNKILVHPSWTTKTFVAQVKDGHWSVSLKTPKAGGPYRIRFDNGKETILDNIFLGDVWLCAGQSNMEMPVKGFRGQPVESSQKTIIGADKKQTLRLFTIQKKWNTREQSSGLQGQWSENTPSAVADFSAAGYFFGRDVQRVVQIPIGLVNCSWSASKIEAWMSRDRLAAFPDIKLPALDAKSFSWPAGTPTLIWNAMVSPLDGFPIKGVVWYQGEANADRAKRYEQLMKSMIDQWRSFFKNPKLPFYFVQLAPFRASGETNIEWAELRESQLRVLESVDNVGMATTVDLGDPTFIHPPKKEEVGQRLAYLALEKTYHIEGIKGSCPVPETFSISKNVVELTFKYAEDGLTPENEMIEGFELCGSDRKFYPAKAKIVNGSSKVQVWNDSIEHPVELRYCFRNYKTGTLKNNYGIPSTPFRLFLQEKRKYLWLDASANFARFNQKDSIDFYLNKVKQVGFTDIVVDIRPISGEVLYDSKIAPRLEQWKGAQGASFDYLGYFIEQGHRLGLRVFASMNVFCGGHNFFNRGLIYSSHPEWGTEVYTPDKGIVSIRDLKTKYGGMTNPVIEENQAYVLAIMKELTQKYQNLDGLILDRVRYDGIGADFSNLSKRKFEKYIGQKLKAFPEDIYRWKQSDGGKYEIVPGPFYKKWLEWRANVIKNFMFKARDLVKQQNPNIIFGTYTGAWYPTYYQVGVNFADASYDPSQDFDWAGKEYKKSSYADALDLFMVGNYYPNIYLDKPDASYVVKNETDFEANEGSWYCVEGSCLNLRRIMKQHPFIGSTLVDQFYDKPEDLTKSLQMNLKMSDGLMIFDIVHIITENLWNQVEKGLKP